MMTNQRLPAKLTYKYVKSYCFRYAIGICDHQLFILVFYLWGQICNNLISVRIFLIYGRIAIQFARIPYLQAPVVQAHSIHHTSSSVNLLALSSTPLGLNSGDTAPPEPFFAAHDVNGAIYSCRSYYNPLQRLRQTVH